MNSDEVNSLNMNSNGQQGQPNPFCEIGISQLLIQSWSLQGFEYVSCAVRRTPTGKISSIVVTALGSLMNRIKFYKSEF